MSQKCAQNRYSMMQIMTLKTTTDELIESISFKLWVLFNKLYITLFHMLEALVTIKFHEVTRMISNSQEIIKVRE